MELGLDTRRPEEANFLAATAFTVCVPAFYEFGLSAAAAVCIAIAWVPVELLFCGKRGAAAAQQLLSEKTPNPCHLNF